MVNIFDSYIKLRLKGIHFISRSFDDETDYGRYYGIADSIEEAKKLASLDTYPEIMVIFYDSKDEGHLRKISPDNEYGIGYIIKEGRAEILETKSLTENLTLKDLKQVGIVFVDAPGFQVDKKPVWCFSHSAKNIKLEEILAKISKQKTL